MALSKLAFNNNGNEFFFSLRNRVEEYFASQNIKKTGNIKLWFKTFVGLTFPPTLLALTFFAGFPMWVNYLMFAMIGVLHAFTGFNVMHDACHGSYSTKPWVNKMMGHSIGLLGSHAPIWKFKHNVLHHTWTNVDGLDDDIAKSPFLRHCPSQPFKKYHKYQHLYMFFLYAISTIWWLFGNDTIKYFKGEVNEQPIPKMTFVDHLSFWGLKLIYTALHVVLPIYFFGWMHGILMFLSLHVALGVLLSTVFQMAHAVEGMLFEDGKEIEVANEKIENEWAIHQIMTTNNFATKSKFATWFMGGLNYQVEHHLFPKISHVHYPKINQILKDVCEKYNVKYNEIPTFWESLKSHVKWMKDLGNMQPAMANA